MNAAHNPGGDAGRKPSNSRPWWQRPLPIAVALVVVLAVVAVAVSGGGDDDDESPATATVDVTGDPLGQFTGEPDDPAIGREAPVARGTDLEGAAMTVGEGGEPSVVIFLAHWCPHCQEEVTEIVEFLEDGPFPAGVEVVSVSTLVDSGRDNYPPEAWLEAEGWPFPTLRDDADSTVAATYGLSGTPFSVFLDAEGRVVQRVSGVIPPAALAGLLEALAEGHSADDGPLLPAADDVRAAA